MNFDGKPLMFEGLTIVRIRESGEQYFTWKPMMLWGDREADHAE